MRFNQKWHKQLFTVCAFAIAMGFLESAVVVYLRKIYYPDGFDFPLHPIDSSLAFTEIYREFATLLMLVCIGYLAGRTRHERFAYFLLSFGIWDIFYYVFLKVLINWPESLMTWDVLFLIPTTWVGPVLSPVILALTMILLAVLIIYLSNNNFSVRINAINLSLFILGSLILILNFIWDYSTYMLSAFEFGEIFNPAYKDALYRYGLEYIPKNFNWYVFIFGQLILLTAIYDIYRRRNDK